MLIGLIQSKLNLMISRVKDKCVGWDVGACSQWEGNDQEMGVRISHPLSCVLGVHCASHYFPRTPFILPEAALSCLVSSVGQRSSLHSPSMDPEGAQHFYHLIIQAQEMRQDNQER